MPYQRSISIICILFFAFLLWLIAMANTGQHSVFFDLAYSLPYGDKISHVILFGLLTLGCITSSGFTVLNLYGLQCYRGTIVTSIFVVVEELSQALIPARTLDSGDFVADAMGIGLFTIIALLLQRYIAKTSG